MIGFESVGAYDALGIDAEFQSLAFLRKGIITPNDRVITCYIDEIIVFRAQDEMAILCQMIIRDNNQVKYHCHLEPTHGHDLSKRITSLQGRGWGSYEVEYFIFGKPRPVNETYGLQIYNEKSELVFSSNQKYMQPIGLLLTNADGDRKLEYEVQSDRKFGIALNSYPTYWLFNPREIVTAAICFGRWEHGKRQIGLVPFPSLFSGGGGTSWLQGDIQALVIDVSNF